MADGYQKRKICWELNYKFNIKKKNNAVDKGNYFLWHVSLKILDKMFMSSKSEYIKFIKWISIILTKKNS